MGSECADNFHAMENGMASKVAVSSCEESTHPLKLEAHNVSYNLDTSANTWVERLTSLEMPWEWKLSSQKKKVLSDINFSVTSGHLLAIMGGSGSGKTSLLNVLSQRANMEDASGSVLIDGYPRDPSFMRDHSAYIMQDDFLIPHLSVIESLTFVAHLKLPSGSKKNQIQREITNLITELGLIHVANSKIGGEKLRGLSGGERRRVSIAMQLLLDPKILFLDEPTSGLDSFTAYNLVGMLTKLAQKDKLLIMTIHQPRSNIFELFDQVMILTEGNMTYYGDANRMVTYFEEIGHRCPELTNPCDFYVDLASIDRKSPRTETESRRRVTHLVKIYKKSYLTKNKRRISHVFDNEMGYFDEFELGQQAKSSSQESLSVKPVKHISVFRQFSVLTRRAIKSHIEDYGFLAVQAFEAICMSLMLGLIFWQLGLGIDGMQDRFGLMYITGALYPYMIILDVIGDYYKELPILYRELQDGLYSVGPYFFSKLMSELPEHSAFIVLYTVPMYWMANLQPELVLFLEAFGVVFTIVLVSRCLALAGAAIMPTYQTSVLFTQSFFTMFLLSSGYLINLDNLFIGMRWFTNLSYLRWGYLALCQIEITNLNFTCTDSDISYSNWTVSNWTVSNWTVSNWTDCNIPGKLALEQYSVDGYSVDIAVAILWTFVIFFLSVFFISLKLISQRPRD